MLPARRTLSVLILLLCSSAAAIYYTGSQPARAAAARANPKPPPAAAKEAKAPKETSKTGGLRDIPYTKAADPKNARRQTLDLYLPPKSAKKPPLVVFIHGGFWTLPDDDYKIGPAFAEALAPAGVAVSLVRYRLAPADAHPAQAEDVAAAVAYLIKAADKYGYDAKRIFLAGHSAGAHLAALVALDPGYLEARGASPKSLAGVIAFSGLYDLRVKPDTAANQRMAVEQAFGSGAERQRSASPTAPAPAAAPPFLILSAEDDFPGFLPDSKRFADALFAAGHRQVERLVIPERDHFSLLQVADKDDEARSILLEFLKIGALPADMAEIMAAKRGWREPPVSAPPLR